LILAGPNDGFEHMGHGDPVFFWFGFSHDYGLKIRSQQQLRGDKFFVVSF
jgi:hypothetical protein